MATVREDSRRQYFYSDVTTKVSYLCSEDIKDKVFKKLISWIREHDAFSGDKICQDDDCQIEAPQLLADIVDDILEFKEEYERS